MAYKWDSMLETGHEQIDNQHKQLINALNNIVEASREGNGEEEISKTIEFLTGYTIMHFSTEEGLQLRYNYPDYKEHKCYHDAFKVTVSEFSQRLNNEGPTEDLLIELTTAIGNWLINHIKGDDFKMAAYIRSKIG